MGVRHKNRGELYAFYCGIYEFGSRSRSADRDRVENPSARNALTRRRLVTNMVAQRTSLFID